MSGQRRGMFNAISLPSHQRQLQKQATLACLRRQFYPRSCTRPTMSGPVGRAGQGGSCHVIDTFVILIWLVIWTYPIKVKGGRNDDCNLYRFFYLLL